MKIIPPLTDEQKRERDRALNPEQVKCGECSMTWREGQALLMNCQNRYCPIAPPRPTLSGLDPQNYKLWKATQMMQSAPATYPAPGELPCPLCGGSGVSYSNVCDHCNGSGRVR